MMDWTDTFLVLLIFGGFDSGWWSLKFWGGGRGDEEIFREACAGKSKRPTLRAPKFSGFTGEPHQKKKKEAGDHGIGFYYYADTNTDSQR